MEQRLTLSSLPGLKRRATSDAVVKRFSDPGRGVATGFKNLSKIRLTLFTVAMLVAASLSQSFSYQSPLIIGNAQPQLLQQAFQDPASKVSVIIQMNPGAPSIENQIASLGGVVTKDLHIINGLGADLPAGQVLQLVRNSGVRWISLDSPLVKSATATTSTVSDTTLLNYYNSEVRATDTWKKTTANGTTLQGQGIGVAILDSGIAPNQDFGYGSRLVGSTKTNTVALTTVDTFGHGTAVAGVAGGNGAASQGQYVGIAPQANLIGVKVSDDVGDVKASDLVSGMQWINDNKAKYNIRVVNISLNNSVAQSYNVDPLDAAAEVLWFNGIVVVASAGNNGTANLFAPANDPFVITVGAVDDAGTPSLSDDTVASFSAWGSDELGNAKPDLVAPGRNLVTTIPSLSVVLAKTHPEKLFQNSYIIASGTSFAAPIVTGAVALLLQNESNLNPDQVKNRLKATALQNTSRGTWDTRAPWNGYNTVQAGAGYLDIYSAVTQTQITATANTGQPISQMITANSAPASSPASAQTTTASSFTGNNYSAKYTVNNQWTSTNGTSKLYQVTVNLTNANTAAISNWKLSWALANGETVSTSSNASCSVAKATITCGNLSSNGTVAAKGGSISFTVTFTNSKVGVTTPISISLLSNNVTSVLKGSAMVATGGSTSLVASSSVNWSSVNWSSVNWSSVNWSSVNWSSVNWSSDYWG